MSYQALYRLYRPQTFDEVVGQKYIIQTIKNAIKEGRTAHAYLLTGPRGTGKTTIAKLIAKGVNCTGEGEKPCGHCENCLAIANGTHPDVVEIDAASNNSVEEVRNLIDRVKYAPIQGKYKVYIIDEVHMMTPSAFNALLKTLEEPPANVIFILATTEVHKVLPTIISRCQRFDFGRISTPDIEKRIRTVLDEEKIAYEEGVVSLVASLADGGVRDALGILDQTIAYAGNNLTEQHVRDIYGVVSTDDAIHFIEVFDSGKIDDALAIVNEFDQKGVDLIRLTNLLINIFKDLIVYNKTSNTKILKLLNKDQVELLNLGISSKTAMAYIDILLEASNNFRRVNTPKSYFELATLKLCNSEKQEDIVKTVEVIKEVPVEKVVEKVIYVEKEVEKQPEPEPIKEEPVVEEVKEEPILEEEPIEEEVKEKAIEQLEPEEKVEIEEPQPAIEEPKVEEQQELSLEEPQEEVEERIEKEEKPQPKPFVEREITDEEIFDYIDQATKQHKTADIMKFNIISQYRDKPKYQRAVSKLADSGPIASGPHGIIICFNTTAAAKVANDKRNYFEIKEFLTELLGREVDYIGISTEGYKIRRAKYVTLRNNKIRPLNPLNPITPRFLKEEVSQEKKNTEEDDRIAERAALFGSLFKVKGE